MPRVTPLLLVVALVACKKGESTTANVADTKPAVAAEGLGEQDIKRVIREGRPGMEKCYDEAIVKKPELDGKLTLVFAVNPDGTVDKTRAGLGGDVGSEALAKCVLDVVVALEFPTAKASTDVQMPIDLRKRADSGVAAPKPDAGGD